MNQVRTKSIASPAHAPCPGCGAPSTGTVSHIPDHEYRLERLTAYATCSDCKSVYQTPMPHESELAAFYPSTYHAMTIDGWLMRKRREMRLSRLRAVLQGKRGVILDYGCGNGAFLYFAAKQMPENTYFGFEYADKREVTRSEDGRVTIVKGTIQDLMEILPMCRVQIMNHVIEHLPDPFEVVSTLFGKLSPGGVFDGQTPNADSLEHRLFGRRWSGYHAPRHTVVFSRDGLKALFDRVGFGESKISGAFNPAGVAVSLASLPHGDHAGMVVRTGVIWHLVVAAACALMPIDLASGAPGMINFWAKKGEG